jgi:hypothetical protein
MSTTANFVEGLSKERLLCYFVLLWGVSWVLGGLDGLLYYATTQYRPGIIELLFGVLRDLLDLLIGGVLTAFGMKLLGLSK